MNPARRGDSGLVELRSRPEPQTVVREQMGQTWDGCGFPPAVIPRCGRPKHQIKRPARGSPEVPRSCSPDDPASLPHDGCSVGRQGGCSVAVSEFHPKPSGTVRVGMTPPVDKMSTVQTTGRGRLSDILTLVRASLVPLVLPPRCAATLRLLFDRCAAVALPLSYVSDSLKVQPPVRCPTRAKWPPPPKPNHQTSQNRNYVCACNLQPCI